MQKKRKILYLITKSDWGGAQQYVYDLATHIDSEKYEPIVALGGDGLLVEELQKAGIRIIRIQGLQRDVSFLKDFRSTLDIIRILFKEKPDVLHVNSSKVGIIGTLFGRLFRIPKVLFTAHGWAFNEDRPLWQKRSIKFLQWCTVLFSHTTIAVSYGVKTDMNGPFVKKKIRVVHLGREALSMKYREDARGIIETKVTNNTASLSDFHSDFWIGTIAELHPTKCLNRAIDAMASITKTFPHVRFVIIHDGQEKEALQQQARNLGLEAHVFFTGTIPNAARLLPAFDLFVLPSQSEAFGYVLIEAGHAGVPVVATDVGGIPDIITSGENGLLVPPRDTPALTNAIRTLIEDKELRHRLAATHHDVAETFSLSKMITETEFLY